MYAQRISLVYILCKKIWSTTITPPYLCVYMQYMLVLYALQDCYMWFESYWWFNGMRNYVELHHNSFNSISICKHTYIQTLNGGMINKWSTKIEHIYLNSCKSRRNYFPFETFIGMNQHLTPTVYVALKLKPRPKYVIQVNNTFCTLTVISFTCRFIDIGYFGGVFLSKCTVFIFGIKTQ